MVDYAPNTALIVVDVQNDFADPAGSLAVSGGEAVVGAANAEIGRAVAAGSPVFYTQDWHPPHTPHFEPDGGIWPVHCVQESWGAAFHPGLRVTGEVVRKGTNGEDGYSGFTMRDPESGDTISTPLEAQLRALEIDRVAVLGLATDYCVRETVLDACRLGFDTVVVREAIAAVNLEPGDGAAALTAMAAAGARVE
jgi:nicotinamidase/pyrazinamidase